jgi:hypothetical protein
MYLGESRLCCRERSIVQIKTMCTMPLREAVSAGGHRQITFMQLGVTPVARQDEPSALIAKVGHVDADDHVGVKIVFAMWPVLRC